MMTVALLIFSADASQKFTNGSSSCPACLEGNCDYNILMMRHTEYSAVRKALCGEIEQKIQDTIESPDEIEQLKKLKKEIATIMECVNEQHRQHYEQKGLDRSLSLQRFRRRLQEEQ